LEFATRPIQYSARSLRRKRRRSQTDQRLLVEQESGQLFLEMNSQNLVRNLSKVALLDILKSRPPRYDASRDIKEEADASSQFHYPFSGG
jgi:hypothetical protein